MNELINFHEYINNNSSNISIVHFSFNFILTIIFCYFTSILYIRYGNSISNREDFSRNFILIGSTTMLIITIVKSSLALSLGLVGALSIIRFRTAIKEPEELSYLFLIISIGLGFGANQGKIVVLSFFLLSILIFIISKSSLKSLKNENLLLNISSTKQKEDTLDEIIMILKEFCFSVNLRRLDEDKGSIDTSFSINVNDESSISKIKNKIFEIDNSASVQFLDNKDIY